MIKPIITILIPVYNAVQFVEDLMQLFLADLTNIEVIIRDDCSNDGTWNKLVMLNKIYPFKLHRNVINQGMCNNWNLLYGDATGKYILKLDADDIFLPDRLAMAIDFFKENDDVDALAFKYEILESETKISKEVPVHNLLVEGIQLNLLSKVFIHNPFHLCFTIFKKETLEKVKSENCLFMNTEVGDLDLLLRLAKNDIKLYYKPVTAGYYRMHQSNSSKTPLKQAKSWLYDVYPKHEVYLKKHLNSETQSILKNNIINYIKQSVYSFKLIDFSYLWKLSLVYYKFKKLKISN